MPESFQGMMIFSVVFLVAGIICMGIEKKITGYYKAANVFGRFYAFWAVNAMFGGILYLILNLISGAISELSFQMILPLIITEALGVVMYVRVYKKTPAFLKKRCLLDLTICGLGVNIRVALWFIWIFVRAQWEYMKPEVYILEDGTEVYVYKDGSVYQPGSGRHGQRVTSGSGNSVIWDY